MHPSRRFAFQFGLASILVILNLLLILACGPTAQQRPTGLAGQYDDAKVMFKRGKFDRSLDFTDSLAASPPNPFTERARVLRAVIFTGLIHGYKYMADAYSKGVDNAKDPHYKAAFGRQRHDTMQLGGKRALDLGEVTQQLIQGDALPKELTLEASYPTTEGPTEVKDLIRISQGGWVENEQQDAAAIDAVRKGVDESLAEVIGADRAKARAVLASGSAKLDGMDFSLYLGHSLFEGASFFDRKHIHDPQKFRTLLNLADGSAKAGLALLKDNPNKDKEAELKKLQDQIKTALKSA
jgi:hypothetical protein